MSNLVLEGFPHSLELYKLLIGLLYSQEHNKHSIFLLYNRNKNNTVDILNVKLDMAMTIQNSYEKTRLTRLVFLFKAILGKQNIRQFWIKDMSDIRGSDLKSVTIEFNNADEAERAQKLFHRFEYRNGKDLYPINAYLEFEKPRRKSPSAYRYGQDRFDSYSRGRSRSPHYDTSKLDLEIELLRKQRLIVEEERRLLFEKKKLELVKEFGPSALQEFESSEFSRAKHRHYRPREPSPIRSRPKKRSRPNRPITPPQRRMPAPSKKLPNFLWPCKLILKDIKNLILTAGVESKREISVLLKMIRITLRKRLVVLCEGKPIMSASEIAALYRERYSVTTDEVLVAKHLKDLRGSHMSMEDHREMVKDAKKDIAKEEGRKAKEEVMEKKNGEEINEGEKKIKMESPKEVEQDKAEKNCEVHDVTDTTDVKETAKEIKLESTNIMEANCNENIDISKEDIQSTEEAVDTEELIPNKKEIMTNEEEIIPNKEEIIPNEEEIMPDKIIPNKEEIMPDKIIPNKEEIMPNKITSNEKEQNDGNIENAEEKGVNLDDCTGSDSNIVLDEANLDDWIEGEGEDWN